MTAYDISIPAAATAADGYLAQADWNTFNGKQAGHAILTSLAAMTYASGSFVSITAANTAAIRTYAQTLSDIGAAASSHAMSTHSDEDTYTLATTGSISSTGALGFITGDTNNAGLITIWDGSANTITITAPALAGNYALTLPTTDGAASEFLQTNGSGVLTWAAGGGGAGDVTAGANIDANAVVIGDDGAKGVKKSTMLVSDAGEMTNASQPAFLAYPSAGLLNVTGDGTVYTVVYNTEVFDQGADFDGTSTFTAPVTGKYSLKAQAYVHGITQIHSLRRWKIVTSNRTYNSEETLFSGAGAYSFLCTTIADMDANDTAVVTIDVHGSTKVVNIGATIETFFSGALLC